MFGSQIETALRDPGAINWWPVGGILLVFAAGIVAVRRWFARLESREKGREPVRRQAAERAYIAQQHAGLHS